jgi:signal recognition particle subunit SRP54
MGSIKDIIRMIPGVSAQIDDLNFDQRELDHYEAIIKAMTPKERRNPNIIEDSRRRRVAKGSGTDPKDVSGLIESFSQVREMMRRIA